MALFYGKANNIVVRSQVVISAPLCRWIAAQWQFQRNNFLVFNSNLKGDNQSPQGFFRNIFALWTLKENVRNVPFSRGSDSDSSLLWGFYGSICSCASRLTRFCYHVFFTMPPLSVIVSSFSFLYYFLPLYSVFAVLWHGPYFTAPHARSSSVVCFNSSFHSRAYLLSGSRGSGADTHVVKDTWSFASFERQKCLEGKPHSRG